MNQNERRRYLIEELLKERPEYENMQIPSDAGEQKMLLRSLMYIRMPEEIDPAFLQIQDAYLSEENEKKGIVTLADIGEVQPDLSIWKGDVTRLKVGAIVNAANSGMTGCYQPCHNCIDNCIHTYAGIQQTLMFLCQPSLHNRTNSMNHIITWQIKRWRNLCLPCRFFMS